MKFYKCHSGDIIEVLVDNGTNHSREELIPNTVDAAKEKHVPVIDIDNNVLTVTVGSTLHPMTEAHYINFVLVVTNMGVKRVDLTPDAYPIAIFALLDGEEVLEVYAYCNLHGLWKA